MEILGVKPRDVVEFVTLMRRLKQESQLTYRQLEERAAARGEILARSTLADVLGGKRLPRPELLTAFVHACGRGSEATAWLDALDVIARREALEHGLGKADSTG
ncbi:helix-turn-helix domain-containing protein [Saccharopolyspora spinosa]|nr:helix-turn-helix domain-containing protein [Saccharopolyspora spinosa]